MILLIVLLVMSFAAAAMFVLGDYGIVTKVIVCLMAIAAVCLRFVPVLSDSVHFLVPLFMQLILCGWWYIASQLE